MDGGQRCCVGSVVGRIGVERGTDVGWGEAGCGLDGGLWEFEKMIGKWYGGYGRRYRWAQRVSMIE